MKIFDDKGEGERENLKGKRMKERARKDKKETQEK